MAYDGVEDRGRTNRIFLFALAALAFILIYRNTSWMTSADPSQDKPKDQDLPRISKSLGIVGLKNRKNRCFANASLQALNHCHLFSTLITQDEQNLGQKDAIIGNLKRVFAELNNPKPSGEAVSPERLYKACILHQNGSMKNLFEGDRQQDASEFIFQLLQHIESEMVDGSKLFSSLFNIGMTEIIFSDCGAVFLYFLYF